MDPRPKCRLTKEQYDQLVSAYLEQPGRHTHAAESARVNLVTAKRAWKEGWSGPEWAMRPVSEICQERQVELRAILNMAESERAKAASQLRKLRRGAHLDALDEKAREAQAVRVSMSSAIGLLAMTQNLVRKAMPAVERSVDKFIAQGNLTGPQAVDLVYQIAKITQKSQESLHRSMEMVRLHLGEPSQIIGVVGNVADSPVDAQSAVQALGSEALFRKAVSDLMDGNMSSEATQLVELQARKLEGLH